MWLNQISIKKISNILNLKIDKLICLNLNHNSFLMNFFLKASNNIKNSIYQYLYFFSLKYTVIKSFYSAFSYSTMPSIIVILLLFLILNFNLINS
jgi:hypothetical protein